MREELSLENMSEIERSQVLSELWSRYQQKNDYVSDLSWKEAVASAKELYSKTFIDNTGVADL